jgi:Tfp pilus assembly protein PilF
MKNRNQRRAEKTNRLLAIGAVSPQVRELFLNAVSYHQAGHLGAAEQLYRQVLQSESGHADTLNMWGILAQQTGRLDFAKELLDRAVAQNPRNPEFHTNLGNVLNAQGKLDEAVSAYLMALRLKPDLVIAHFNLALVRRTQGDSDKAITSLGQALKYQPGNVEARCNLGLILKEQGRLAEAIDCFELALQHRSDHAEAWCNLGIAHNANGNRSVAVECFTKAIILKPNLVEAINGLGTVFTDLDHHTDTVAWFVRALACLPSYPAAYHNLGNALREQNRLDEAIVCLDRAVSLEPGLADAHYTRSLLLLQKGEFRRAWADYEWRWLVTRVAKVPMRKYPQALWQGDAANGRTILLWLEQGAGDSIQFVRFAVELQRLGWRVIVEARPDLARLFRSMPGIEVISAGAAEPHFDVHCPLLSLPRGLGGVIPAQIPYLHADPVLVEDWRLRLAASDGLKVGIAWRGSALQKRDWRRSASARIFADLLDLPGLCVVNLQKQASADELAVFAERGLFLDADPELQDFADTAGLIANLDLVISVDTSVCHLAGAIGARVWTMLDFAPDWRYASIDNFCPWYPTMRLFRQPLPGRWDLLAHSVREELKAVRDGTQNLSFKLIPAR